MSTTISELADESAVRERFELIRRMAEDLAHELKNPLNAVVINLEVLRARVRGGHAEAALERIDVIESELRRLHTLLDHTLRLMRADQGTAYAANDVLSEVELLGGVLAKLSRREFVCGQAGDEVFLSGPREPLRFALLWLVAAAIEASPEMGDAIRLEPHADGQLRLTLTAPPACAAALRAAAPGARRLLGAGEADVSEVVEGDGEARVHLTLPLRGDGAHAFTGHTN